MEEIKTCKDCGLIGPIEKFQIRKENNKISFRNFCITCWKIKQKSKQKKYRENNKDKIKKSNKKYYENNFSLISENHKIYIKDNKEKNKLRKRQYYLENKNKYKNYCRKYRKNNLDKERKRVAEYHKNKCKTSSFYKIRKTISNQIRIKLKNNNCIKNNSVINYLSYTITELKQRLEAQFDPWMNWNNWGVYNPKIWNDQDTSTWTWQLDHIVPQSLLPYTSMEDDNFKKCWALENLRPYSSKQNILDSNRR